MTEQQGWVPVALSASIEPATSAGAVIDGTEVVVWRDSKGEAHVWEDRCPHRGMRMSFGFVRGDHIACLYHGWQYDSTGQCRHIPAHPDLEVPATIRVPTYACEERSGIIWTCLTDSADIAGIPDVTGGEKPVRSLYLDCSLADAGKALAHIRLPMAAGPAEPAVLKTILSFCWELSAGATKLLIAGQSIGPQKAALHIVSLGASDSATSTSLARWAETLRRTIETTTLATPEYA
ncbi:MAG: Rieske 2Fe-2S domain-containing protein [Allorhizobium sp.]